LVLPFGREMTHPSVKHLPVGIKIVCLFWSLFI
jgi:hypothetical protein